MAKVRRSARPAATPAPPPAPSPAPAKVRMPPPPTANVIDLSLSPGPAKNDRKRGPLDLEGVEMWTPHQKLRLDDECCILTADPFKVDKPPAATLVCNADVAVVAERGKVACRDYPHARSACAKYPFSTTPHERHCEQCFCYVCDIAAPCLSWKQDHCHASDKDCRWKVMRVQRQKQCK